MPELPEVEVTRRGLAPHLAGRVISAVEVRQPRLRWPVPRAVRLLPGRKVRGLARRGKYLLVRKPVPRGHRPANAGAAAVAGAGDAPVEGDQGHAARRDPRRRLEP